MASVTSLGVHQPTALPYLIQEHILPLDPPADAYTWENIPSHDDSISGDDELLVTNACVVWSRGGLVRKSFRFEVEEEPVTRAILTSFSSERQKHHVLHRSEDSRKAKGFERLAGSAKVVVEGNESKHRSNALVVFLKT